MTPPDFDNLQQHSILREYRFESRIPLIARFRTGWHSIAGKWAIRYIMQQQSAFNQRLLTDLNALNQQLSLDSNDTNECVAMTDREVVELTRTVAELTQQVIQLQRAVAELEARLAAPQVKADD